MACDAVVGAEDSGTQSLGLRRKAESPGSHSGHFQLPSGCVVREGEVHEGNLTRGLREVFWRG